MKVNLLEFATLIVSGFTSCAEFGSHAFVHPVIRHLPPEHHIKVEKGLLKSFGRVMPVLMTLCPVLSIVYAIEWSAASTVRWLSAAAFVAALVSTIIFNVPINLATGRWNPGDLPSNWKEIRNRMGAFPGPAFLALIGRIPSALLSSSNPQRVIRARQVLSALMSWQ